MRENDLLAWFQQHTPQTAAVAVGIGDDMAAVRCPGELVLLKIDQCLDGVHFDLATCGGRLAGQKAVNRCLSDCAAMGALPLGVLVSVALPRGLGESTVRELYQGCLHACRAAGAALVGGDTGMWDHPLVITVAAAGYAPGPTVLRRGGQVGDVVCVTGPLGGSLSGRHLHFTPRLWLAQQLLKTGPIHAMMDLSDGLAQDLPRLCAASGLGAVIELGTLPVHTDARTLAARDHRAAWWHALCDGEDYELLLTTDPATVHRWQAMGVAPGLRAIGTLTAGNILSLQTETGKILPWPVGGWEYRGQLKPR